MHEDFPSSERKMHTEIWGILGFGDAVLVKRHLVNEPWTSGRQGRKQISGHYKGELCGKTPDKQNRGLPLSSDETPTLLTSIMTSNGEANDVHPLRSNFLKVFLSIGTHG